MKKVQILLSTFNGEKYLCEQLDSILNQSYSNISILIRDDGSTDNTISILQKYSLNYSSIQYYQGDNIGAKNSFIDLIKHADFTADYYSFSDQDDVWLDNKISQAVHRLNEMNQNKAILYCGRTNLVNCNLEPIHSTIKSSIVRVGFGNALVENVCSGCTCVMNQNLLKLIQSHLPEFFIMHDWWFYLFASCFGDIYYDDESFILYRQHGNNVVGARANYFDEFKRRLSTFRNNRGKISKQVKAFYSIYITIENQKLTQTGESLEKEKLIKSVIGAQRSLRYRMKLLGTKKVYRQRKMDDFIFKVLFLIGCV